MKLIWTFGIATIAILTACAGIPEQNAASSAPSSVVAKPQLEFIDLAGFDRELNASLTAKLPNVNVAIGNAVAAHDIPERIQAWLQSVDAGGGTVTTADDQRKKVSCKVTYKVAGSNMSQNLRCAGTDYRIKASTKLTYKSGKIKG